MLKLLPDNWMNTVLQFFNQILSTGRVPDDWADIELIPLHKKGDPEDPANYRGIALIKTITKLVTAILENRLYRWAEDQKLIPDCQAGFRKKRSCSNQIFSLMGLAQIHSRIDERKIFVIFVDFKRAFDSVSHDLLWRKLHHMGVSGKILRTMNSLYSKANFRVRTNSGHTPPIEVTEGVLQGEILSPLLFSLFIADMEKHFRDQGLHGISINSQTDALILMYTDDTAILCYSEGDAQKKLHALHAYCSPNRIDVNVEKTKIMLISRDGIWSKTDRSFRYNNEEVEIVKNYTYLGVPFSHTGNFGQAARYFRNKGMAALNSINRASFKGRIKNWKCKTKLFNSCVSPCLLYGTESWGYHFSELLETVQLKFLKQNLGVIRNTASHAVRMETGWAKLETQIFKKMLSLWYDILVMDPDRAQRKIFNKLLSLEEQDKDKPRFWTSQVAAILKRINMEELWQAQCAELVSKSWKNILSALHELSISDDLSKLQNSTSSVLRNLQTNTTPEEYLFNSQQNVRRIWSQLRLASPIFPFFIGSGKLRQKLDPRKDCSICNLKSRDTVEHFLFVCRPFEASRRRFLYPHLANMLKEPTVTPTTLPQLQPSTSPTSRPHLQPTTTTTTVSSFLQHQSPTTQLQLQPTSQTCYPTNLLSILSSTSVPVRTDMYNFVLTSLRNISFITNY